MNLCILRGFARLCLVALLLGGTLVQGAVSDSPANALEEEGNDVLVIGRRAETRELRRAGHSLSIKPTEATRFNATTLLRQENGLALPETGRINASGFVIPRVRGQDSRLTEIYFDDVLLQDPLTGLPLVDDLDLRAFGELRMHLGVSPFDLPGLNPVGAMEYRLLPILDSSQLMSTDAGINWGEPYGHAVWSLFEGRLYERKPPEDSSAALGRYDWKVVYHVYARTHETRGRFPYYDDHATPYNVDDDLTSTRTNNDRRSKQLLPVVVIATGPHVVKVLSFVNQSENGLPTQNTSLPSLARSKTQAALTSLSWQVAVPTPLSDAKGSVTTSVTRYRDERSTSDPTSAILGTEHKGLFSVETWRGSMAPRVDGARGSIVLTLEGSNAKVRTAAGDDRLAAFRRQTEALTAGSLWRPLPGTEPLSVELKSNWVVLQDRLDDHVTKDIFAEDEPPRRHTVTKSQSVALSWQADSWQVYLQGALSARAPTLLEEFGDGGSVRANSELTPEHLRHMEVGGKKGFLSASRWQLNGSAALFSDSTTDKITFVPSISQTLRALNIKKTRLHGLELSETLVLAPTELMLAYTRLWAMDLSQQEVRQLPSTPEHTAVAQIKESFGALTWRWLARYRSQSYRDEANSIVVPAATVHDTSIDYALNHPLKAQLGLSVINVFDKTHFPIVAPGTSANRGETSYSDFAGSPLPGRQWTANASVVF